MNNIDRIDESAELKAFLVLDIPRFSEANQ